MNADAQQQFFKNLRKQDPENQRCFDCGNDSCGRSRNWNFDDLLFFLMFIELSVVFFSNFVSLLFPLMLIELFAVFFSQGYRIRNGPPFRTEFSFVWCAQEFIGKWDFHFCLTQIFNLCLCRSLGVHVTFVRSVTLDSWSEEQKNSMATGGNSKCKDYFTQQASSVTHIHTVK